jgi:hypothetical protein
VHLGRRSVRHAVAAKMTDYDAASQKLGRAVILLISSLIQRDRDVRDMTVLWYVAVASERNSKRDGQLLLARQDVFPGKG